MGILTFSQMDKKSMLQKLHKHQLQNVVTVIIFIKSLAFYFNCNTIARVNHLNDLCILYQRHIHFASYFRFLSKCIFTITNKFTYILKTLGFILTTFFQAQVCIWLNKRLMSTYLYIDVSVELSPYQCSVGVSVLASTDGY